MVWLLSRYVFCMLAVVCWKLKYICKVRIINESISLKYDNENLTLNSRSAWNKKSWRPPEKRRHTSSPRPFSPHHEIRHTAVTDCQLRTRYTHCAIGHNSLLPRENQPSHLNLIQISHIIYNTSSIIVQTK